MFVSNGDFKAGVTIVCIKLVTGEEIIGKYCDKGDTGIILDRPFIMIMQPNAQGVQELGMMPYCISASESKIWFNIEHVAAGPATVSKNFEEGYLHHTSGISIATPEDVASIATK
jgi:hypothetical protein